jgi:hypothetical protein
MLSVSGEQGRRGEALVAGKGAITMLRHRFHRNRGQTLVEYLVIIAIIGVLIHFAVSLLGH